ERLFPPPSGLSYSTWFCVERFSTAPQAHPVRLLTMVRRATSSEQHYVCLAVVLSGKDRSLTVSTKEELLQTYSADESSEEASFYEILPCCARFRCGELIAEGQWHHLVLVMSKGMLKNSMATLYLDGQLISTVKLHYIHSAPGGSGSTNPPVMSTVYGYIGTPPAQRQLSNLVWRLGPSHFLEEVLPATSVAAIFELGPNYVGSFQAVYLPCVRSFVPKPVATNLQYVGGAAAILGLVAMASDVEGLYAAVKALVCVVKSDPLASKEMERINGYQLLAMLLKKKRSLLNSHILHLTFSLVGTVDSGHETSIIPNSTAFQDLLCDFEFQLIPRLLLTLRDTSLSQPTVAAISNVLSLLLQGFPNPYDLLRACEELVRTLGFDWLLMFMEEHLHSTTVTVALRILVVLLSNQPILNRFREGLSGGGWLDQTDSVLTNKIGTVLGEHKALFDCTNETSTQIQASV
ncbi:hypothetical protein GOODEAATRI_014511, partial [Goodea atripinnis]